MNSDDLDAALQKFVEDVEKIKGWNDADVFRTVAVSYHQAIMAVFEVISLEAQKVFMDKLNSQLEKERSWANNR
jgi:uncharacterized protein (DUF2267 family)